MGREYKVRCTPLSGTALAAALRKLPSPILRPDMREIYSFRVDTDGYYLIDHLIDRPTAAAALQIFVDAGLSADQSVSIVEP